MTQLDMLIDELGADLRPVRRLGSPAFRALGWLSMVAALALALAAFADLRGMADRLLAAPDMWLSVVGSTATMVLAAVASFELSVPGRNARWALLPIPALLLWLAMSGLGCLRSQLTGDVEPASFSESQHCFTFIVALSVPLSILMVLMIRRACPLRPNLTAATIGLATAAGAATLLNFFHPFDASAIDLVVHAAAVGLVILVNRLLGGRLLSPASLPRSSTAH